MRSESRAAETDGVIVVWVGLGRGMGMGGCETTMLTSLPDPQGSLLNTWKPVWVVLSEDAIEFYKKKTDRSPKGMIPLKGAAILSPCQDFEKRLVSRK